MGEAKSYAERLFDFPEIGPLTEADAKLAIVKPAEDENVEVSDKAVDVIGPHMDSAAHRSFPFVLALETASLSIRNPPKREAQPRNDPGRRHPGVGAMS